MKVLEEGMKIFMYSLFRISDRAGDSGNMSTSYRKINNDLEIKENARPEIGMVMRVGSHYSRSYSHQDYWQTTEITEIIEDKNEIDGSEYVKFRTKNSIYEWRKY